MNELIDRQSRVWAVLAVIAGVVLFISLELKETPDMSATDIALRASQQPSPS